MGITGFKYKISISKEPKHDNQIFGNIIAQDINGSYYLAVLNTKL